MDLAQSLFMTLSRYSERAWIERFVFTFYPTVSNDFVCAHSKILQNVDKYRSIQILFRIATRFGAAAAVKSQLSAEYTPMVCCFQPRCHIEYCSSRPGKVVQLEIQASFGQRQQRP